MEFLVGTIRELYPKGENEDYVGFQSIAGDEIGAKIKNSNKLNVVEDDWSSGSDI